MHLSSITFLKAPVLFGNNNKGMKKPSVFDNNGLLQVSNAREQLQAKHTDVGTQNVRKRFEEARKHPIKIDFKDKD